MMIVGAWIVPRALPASRPAVAAPARSALPATLHPRAAWPWPDMVMLGIEYLRGAATAGSKSVPAWRRAGVVARSVSSYQREPFRPPLLEATPALLTWMLCAVQRVDTPVMRFLWIRASKRRSSIASRGETLPSAGVCMGNTVVGTVTKRLAEIAGVAPGLVIRRMARRLNVCRLGPMKYPSVAPGSSLLTPRGESGPSVPKLA